MVASGHQIGILSGVAYCVGDIVGSGSECTKKKSRNYRHICIAHINSQTFGICRLVPNNMGGLCTDFLIRGIMLYGARHSNKEIRQRFCIFITFRLVKLRAVSNLQKLKEPICCCIFVGFMHTILSCYHGNTGRNFKSKKPNTDVNIRRVCFRRPFTILTSR